MPTYLYICGVCNTRHEIFHSITAGARRKCPKCGAFRLKRQIGGGSGIIFKGSGFFSTDYKKPSAPEPGTES